MYRCVVVLLRTDVSGAVLSKRGGPLVPCHSPTLEKKWIVEFELLVIMFYVLSACSVA